jgi:hypothetical protein
VPDASAAPVQNMGTLPTRVRNFAITLSGPDQGFIRPRIELYDASVQFLVELNSRAILSNIAFTPEDQAPIHCSGQGVDTTHLQR